LDVVTAFFTSSSFVGEEGADGGGVAGVSDILV
jgi:hypothetical protein